MMGRFILIYLKFSFVNQNEIIHILWMGGKSRPPRMMKNHPRRALEETFLGFPIKFYWEIKGGTCFPY